MVHEQCQLANMAKMSANTSSYELKNQFNWTSARTLAQIHPSKTDFVISISRAAPLTLLIRPNGTCLTIFCTAIDCTIILINDNICQIRALISWLRVVLVIFNTLIWSKEKKAIMKEWPQTYIKKYYRKCEDYKRKVVIRCTNRNYLRINYSHF